jgi:hypothetical protein
MLPGQSERPPLHGKEPPSPLISYMISYLQGTCDVSIRKDVPCRCARHLRPMRAIAGQHHPPQALPAFRTPRSPSPANALSWLRFPAHDSESVPVPTARRHPVRNVSEAASQIVGFHPSQSIRVNPSTFPRSVSQPGASEKPSESMHACTRIDTSESVCPASKSF